MTLDINDCLAVTKLAHQVTSIKPLTSPDTVYYEEIPEDE